MPLIDELVATNTSRPGTTSLETLRLSGFLSRNWEMMTSSSR